MIVVGGETCSPKKILLSKCGSEAILYTVYIPVFKVALLPYFSSSDIALANNIEDVSAAM